MSRLLLIIFFIVILLPATAESQQPWFFAVLSDPQMGMYAKDKNFTQETVNFKFAIANLNRLHPLFVVICGDLVNRTGDPASVAGNHDVGNVPTPSSAGYQISLTFITQHRYLARSSPDAF